MRLFLFIEETCLQCKANLLRIYVDIEKKADNVSELVSYKKALFLKNLHATFTHTHILGTENF